jgi:hypothetical protein
MTCNEWISTRDAQPPENVTVEARIVNEDGSPYADIICERHGDYLMYCGIGQVVITATSPAFVAWRLSDGVVIREIDDDDL